MESIRAALTYFISHDCVRVSWTDRYELLFNHQILSRQWLPSYGRSMKQWKVGNVNCIGKDKKKGCMEGIRMFHGDVLVNSDKEIVHSLQSLGNKGKFLTFKQYFTQKRNKHMVEVLVSLISRVRTPKYLSRSNILPWTKSFILSIRPLDLLSNKY